MAWLRDAVDRLVADLADNPAAEARRRAFADAVAPLGVTAFAYAGACHDDAPPCLETTFPAAWVEHYRRHRYDRIDPVVLECRRSPLPFRWRDALARPEHGAEARRVFAEAEEFSLRDGYAVPIHAGERRALVSLAVKDASLFEPAAAARREALHLMALHYHLACERAVVAPPAIRLSPREREVLSWAAHGKTGWEIARILHLSERTVTYHVENARAKLGADGRGHAVAKALGLGLIVP